MLGRHVPDQSRVPQESEGRRAVNGLGPWRLRMEERIGLMVPGGLLPARRTICAVAALAAVGVGIPFLASVEAAGRPGAPGRAHSTGER